MNAKQKAHYLESLPEPVLTEVYEFAKSLEPKKLPKNAPQTLNDILGLLKDSPALQGDPVKLVRKMRRECW